MPAPIGYRRRILAVGLIAAGCALLVRGAAGTSTTSRTTSSSGFLRSSPRPASPGVTPTFDGQDGTLRCAEPLDDPEAATRAGLRRVGRARDHARPLVPCEQARRRQANPTRAAQASRRPRRLPAACRPSPRRAADGRRSSIPTIGELIDTDPRLSYLSMLLQRGRAQRRAIRVSGPITVFAPTDEAFDELSADTNARLRSDPELLSQAARAPRRRTACISSADLTIRAGHRWSTGTCSTSRTDGTTILVEGVADRRTRSDAPATASCTS